MISSRRTIRLGTDRPLLDVRVQVSPSNVALDELVEDARREGHAAGLAAGLGEHGTLLKHVVDALAKQRAEGADALGRGAIELGLEIAQHLLRIEIDAGRYDIETIVRETLHEARVGRAECLVHLHPDDYDKLADIPFRSGTKLQPDRGVPRGEVQIESALGCIVRDLDRALESIGARLRGELDQ